MQDYHYNQDRKLFHHHKGFPHDTLSNPTHLTPSTHIFSILNTSLNSAIQPFFFAKYKKIR